MTEKKRKTVLLVEDDVLIALDEQMVLEQRGYSVLTVHSGEQAVETARGHPDIDLALMDIDLGKGMDGVEAAEIILKERELPVVFLSSHTESDVVERTERITSYGYIVKNSGITVLDTSIKMAFKLFEARMREQERREELVSVTSKLEGILNALPDLLFEAGQDGHIHSRSGATLAVHPDEFMGKKVFEVLPPEASAVIMAAIREADDKGLSSGKQYKLDLPQGACWYELSVSRMTATQGQTPRFIGLARDITERKRAEGALRESGRQFSSAFGYAAIGMALVSPEGRWLRVNHALCELVGYTESELLERTFQDITHPEDLETDLDYVHQMLAGKIQTYQMEKRYYHKAGHIVWVLLSVSLMWDEQGKPLYFISQVQNITERKRMEEALRRERDILQCVMNGAKNSHLVYLDRGFNFVRVNEVYAATCGYRPEEMIGKNHFALYPHAENEAIFAHVRDTGKPFEVRDKLFEFPDQPERGATYWDWTLTPVKDETGQVEGLVFSLFETTERKRLEQEREAALIKYRTLFDSFPLGITVTDRQGNIIETNRVAEQILGLSSQEHLQRNIDGPQWRIVRPNGTPMPPDEFASVRALREQRLVENIEMGIIKSPSETTWLNVTAIPFPLQDHGVVVTYGDITERKRAEEKIKALLAEKELILNEVHHRIKNNMGVLRGLLSLQAGKSKEPAVINALHEAISRLESMSLLYDRLYRSENLRAMSVRDYLPPLVKKIVSLFPTSARVKMEQHCDDVVLDVKTLVPLGIIVNELITNAMKYAFMGRESGTLRVSAVKGEDRITITVEDDGVGLPEGFDTGSSKGFGFTLVKMLCGQIGARLTIEARDGMRVVVELEAPCSEVTHD